MTEAMSSGSSSPAGDRLASDSESAAPETISRSVQVCNVEGLHLRAATQFVQLAARFDARFTVATDASEADGTSMMELLTLGAYCGKQLTIQGTGPEAQCGVDALVDLVAHGFRPPAPS